MTAESLFTCKHNHYFLVVNYEGTRLAYISENGRMHELPIEMKQESDFEYNSCSNGCQTNYSRGICLFRSSLLFVGLDQLVLLDVDASFLSDVPVCRTIALERLEAFHLDRSTATVFLTTSADNSVSSLSLEVTSADPDRDRLAPPRLDRLRRLPPGRFERSTEGICDRRNPQAPLPGDLRGVGQKRHDQAVESEQLLARGAGAAGAACEQ